MGGPIVLILVMLVVFPPVLLGGGMAVAAGLSWVLTKNAEETHEGSELIELNR